jgi:hypothetical protein
VFLEIAKNSAIVEGVLITLATALSFKLIPAIVSLIQKMAPLAIPVALFAILALLIDDIVVAFQGGKSVIKDWIDALLGVGTAEKAIRKIKETVTDLTQGFKDMAALARLSFKSQFGLNMDRLNTDELLEFNRIMARADARNPFGNGGEAPIDILGGGRRERLQQAVQDRANPTVPARLGRTFTNAAPGAGVSVSVPTSLVIQVPPGSSKENATFIADIVGDVLGRRNDEVIAAMKTEVPK